MYTTFYLTVLGGPNAGKTSVIEQYVQGHFTEEYDPAIGVEYRRIAEVDGNSYMFDIMDLYGENDVGGGIDYCYNFIKESKGFLLVYSITSLDTFNKIEYYYENALRISKFYDTELPAVLIGNKCDLEDRRQVTTEQGEELARKLNCPFFETSAKNRICIVEAFDEVIREIGTHHPHGEEKEPEKESKRSRIAKFFKRN